RSVGVVAVGVGIAGGVEPVAAPALAVVWRLEQALHLALIGSWLGVSEKRVHLRRRRRQPGQIEAEPAQQRRALGFGGRLYAANENGSGIAAPESAGSRIEAQPRALLLRSVTADAALKDRLHVAGEVNSLCRGRARQNEPG